MYINVICSVLYTCIWKIKWTLASNGISWMQKFTNSTPQHEEIAQIQKIGVFRAIIFLKIGQFFAVL